jgi:hypothetical protein
MPRYIVERTIPGASRLSEEALRELARRSKQIISSKVEKTVEKVLRDRLSSDGFAGAEIRLPDRDFDGDPILVVDVNYRFLDRPISSKVTFSLTTEIRKALMALGESRFPQVRHRFNEQQKIAR